MEEKRMRFSPDFSKWQRRALGCAATMAAILVGGGPCQAQEAGTAPNAAIAHELNKYPGLLEEFGKLFQRLMMEVKYPDGRKESKLLPVLPESTMTYVAVSNYGEPARQIVKIFREELRESEPLRKWWGSSDVATEGPKVEAFLEKFSEFEEYLGNETVLAGTMEGKDPKFLLVAETRKAGLKSFLEQWMTQLADKGKPVARVMDTQGLASVKESRPSDTPIFLVRPDYIVMGDEAAEIRKFAERLDKKSGELSSAPFGQRVAKAYEGGTTVLAAADLQKIISKTATGNASNDQSLKQTGFGDAKYAVWQHTGAGSAEMSKGELSFTGPRHGAASWLGKPRSLNSLDFVSPNTIVAITIGLKDPAKIYDEAKEMAESTKSNTFAMVPMLEQGLKFSLRDDVLGQLGGEITAELDSLAPDQLKWRAILKVNDTTHLQKTLSGLLEATHTEATKDEAGGVTTYSFRGPGGPDGMPISYAIVDGYLIVGSGREAVAESAELHRAGGSLAKSKKFLASLPPGRTREASGMFYEDPVAMASMQIGRIMPDLAESLTHGSQGSVAQTMWVYGDEAAIREESVSAGLDIGGALVVAAIAIPNLLRSKLAANEASAVGSLRTVVTAQITYGSTYPVRGFAPNLATLGPGPEGSKGETAQHANLIDASLAGESCTANEWCVKSGYRFRMTANCKQRNCTDFTAVATPETTNSGTRSFCATSDGVIRYKVGEPLVEMVSGAACKAWQALQ
jgi:type IV pilus assembly protein PilA